MAPRNSALYLGGTAGLLALLAGLLTGSGLAVADARDELSRNARLVRELELTDLCIFTEAAYTRHPAVTDLATAFQDAPASFEHFPSGALVGPPAHLTGNHVGSH